MPGETGPMTYQQISTHKRVLFFDQIKALMVALVIIVHVPPAFSGMGWHGVRIPIESADPFFPVAGGLLFSFCNSFFMCMLFLLSGYFVPRSVHRKGIKRYLKARILRLGVPFIIGLLLINNTSVLLGSLSPESPLAALPWDDIPFNRVGVLWFLVVLFGFDLLYCAWIALRGDHFSVDTTVPTPQLRSWLASAIVLGILEVLMVTRTELWAALIRSPLNGLGYQGMHIFTYTFLFFLGCKASHHHWLEQLNAHLVVRWFRFSVALVLCMATITLVLIFNGSITTEGNKLYGLTALLYPTVGWGMISYLLLWFQRNEHRCGQWLATAGVDSYGAYIIHPLVLVMVLWAIGFVGLNHWLIALATSALGVIISFGITNQIRLIPMVARIL